jgi:hypothetical protein
MTVFVETTIGCKNGGQWASSKQQSLRFARLIFGLVTYFTDVRISE